MPLVKADLTRLMISAGGFIPSQGIGVQKTIYGLASGIIRSITELAAVTIVFSGAVGTPGSAQALGYPTADAGKMKSYTTSAMATELLAGGVATLAMASAISETATALRTTAQTIVPAVSAGQSIATGTGIVSPGGILLDRNLAANVILSELISQGLIGGEGSRRIARATAAALSGYLQTLSLTLPVVGGSPSSGTTSFPMTSTWIK